MSDADDGTIENMTSAAEKALYDFAASFDLRSLDELPREAIREMILAAIKASDNLTESPG